MNVGPVVDRASCPTQVSRPHNLGFCQMENPDFAKEFAALSSLISRASLYSQISLDGSDRNLDKDAGYPTEISVEQYRKMYDREGVAQRVVNVYPDECWALDPIIKENEEDDLTPFEEAWKLLVDERNAVHYLHRADRISGIGRYGVILIGIDDGRPLNSPVAGIRDDSETLAKDVPPKRELLFLRTFDETLVTISKYEERLTSPRYGYPTMYKIKLFDPNNEDTSGTQKVQREVEVHWHRVLHIADNRESSEIFGAPRQRCVYNRLHDLRKTLGGSAEMFWKGGFPGYAFEMPPEIASTATIDEDSLKAQIANYYNGLERYLTLRGLVAKPLSPQVVSPEYHVKSQLMAISLSIEVPMRVFIGSEEAKLSSTQDAITWNKRLKRRQDKYITPLLLRPFVSRLVLLGVLPKPTKLICDWPDLNTSTDLEKSEVAERLTKAMSLYVSSGLNQLMHPETFFTLIIGLSMEQAKQAWKTAQENEIEFKIPQSTMPAERQTSQPTKKQQG